MLAGRQLRFVLYGINEFLSLAYATRLPKWVDKVAQKVRAAWVDI